MKPPPPDRARVLTEQRHPRTRHLHTLSAVGIVELFAREDRAAFQAVRRAGPRLARLIEAAEPGFVAGGRLVYVGAGTSGRLGVLDASEAPPTFCVPEGRVVGIIAGGDGALRRSSEGAEDDPRGAWPALDTLDLSPRDTLVAIAAGGTTPYALGALAYAAQRPPESRPLAALLCCSPPPEGHAARHVVVLKVGPEVLAGSTRLKAGTATKLALNTISTALMIRTGRVYQNLMVDLRATNDKLRDRAARIITTLTGLARDAALELLEEAGGSVKHAVVMHRLGVPLERAESLLAGVNGRVGDLLDAPPTPHAEGRPESPPSYAPPA